MSPYKFTTVNWNTSRKWINSTLLNDFFKFEKHDFFRTKRHQHHVYKPDHDTALLHLPFPILGQSLAEKITQFQSYHKRNFQWFNPIKTTLDCFIPPNDFMVKQVVKLVICALLNLVVKELLNVVSPTLNTSSLEDSRVGLSGAVWDWLAFERGSIAL